MTASAALAGLRVLDVSDNVAGQYCSRMLADYGADVTLIEPPAGCVIRRTGPFAPADAVAGATDKSLLFVHLNVGKASRVLDRSAPGGDAVFEDLVRQADIVVLDEATDPGPLRTLNPRCIVAQVTAFGTQGPLHAWRGTEMIFQALSGMMNNNGEAGRPPLFGVGHRASYSAGVVAFIGVLGALFARGRHGEGQEVRTEIAETAASMCFPYLMQYIYNGSIRSRGEQQQPICPVQCRDGWICIWIYPHRFAAACETLGRPDLIADLRFARQLDRQAHWSEFVAIMGEHLAGRMSEDLVALLQSNQIIAAKSYRLTEIVCNEHLRQRGFWETVQTPLGEQRVLGPQFRMSGTPRTLQNRFPVLSGGGQSSPQAAAPITPPDAALANSLAAGPLTGVRVVELTTAWAGPMAGRVLAFLGAEVIHVEAATRVNSWRSHRETANPRNYPDQVAGDRPYNRSFLFNSQNINKLSMTLDIKKPVGAAALLDLVSGADVLICNFRPGTLRKVGLDYDRLRTINPGIIVAEMPAFGSSGPLSGHAALGPTMEMAAGMSGMIGYPGEGPETTGPSYLDPIGGNHGAAAVMLALVHRQTTGQGQHIEIPQVEAAMQFVGEELLLAMATGQDRSRNGNAVDWAAPHDAFPSIGEDQWVAICATDKAAWVALCTAIGASGLATDPRFCSLEMRLRNQATLYEAIAAWTRGLTKHEAAQRLQAMGVAAAPVQNPQDLADSAYLADRGFFTELEHREAGTHPYPGLPIYLSRDPGSQHRAAPCFGQDNRMVLTEIMGLSAASLNELQSSGALADIPVR